MVPTIITHTLKYIFLNIEPKKLCHTNDNIIFTKSISTHIEQIMTILMPLHQPSPQEILHSTQTFTLNHTWPLCKNRKYKPLITPKIN